MTPEAQLDFVKKYLQQERYSGQSKPHRDPTSLVDLYLIIFTGNGSHTGQPGSTVLFPVGSKGYDMNRLYDPKNTGQITVGQINSFVTGVYNQGNKPANRG